MIPALLTFRLAWAGHRRHSPIMPQSVGRVKGCSPKRRLRFNRLDTPVESLASAAVEGLRSDEVRRELYRRTTGAGDAAGVGSANGGGGLIELRLFVALNISAGTEVVSALRRGACS